MSYIISWLVLRERNVEDARSILGLPCLYCYALYFQCTFTMSLGGELTRLCVLVLYALISGWFQWQNFIYINDYVAGEGVVLEQMPVVGCECKDCFKEKSSCCGRNAGSDFAYFSRSYAHNCVRLAPGMPIYECNDRCNCGPDCLNRVVQKGRKHRVCIFRTANGRGWGVKAMQKIKRGSFIMEYVGEVGKLVPFIAVEMQWFATFLLMYTSL